MATDELSSKLSHRLQIEEGTADPVAVDVPRADSPDEKASSADAELSAMLTRREALNQGQEQPRSSAKVFNPYTEFKEFSRNQIKDMERMFKT